MAISTLFTLLDDMAVLLDDIAVMTKVAAQKTVAVVSDDLAVNAKQVEGIASKRELPVVWAVAKGSLKNKAILVPAAASSLKAQAEDLVQAVAVFQINPEDVQTT